MTGVQTCALPIYSKDKAQINDAARKAGVDPHRFGKFVDKMKKLEGRGASENFSFDELVTLANQFKGGGK